MSAYLTRPYHYSAGPLSLILSLFLSSSAHMPLFVKCFLYQDLLD